MFQTVSTNKIHSGSGFYLVFGVQTAAAKKRSHESDPFVFNCFQPLAFLHLHLGPPSCQFILACVHKVNQSPPKVLQLSVTPVPRTFIHKMFINIKPSVRTVPIQTGHLFAGPPFAYICGVAYVDQITGHIRVGQKAIECKYYLFFGWMSLRYI